MFTFEAVSTAIKGGQVKFTLPSGWTPMKPPPADGKITAVGELRLSRRLVVFKLKLTVTRVLKRHLSLFRMGVGRSPLESLNWPYDNAAVTITINKFEHATTKIVS